MNFFRYSFHTNVFSGPDGIPENFGDIVTGRVSPNTRTGRFLLDRKVDRPPKHQTRPRRVRTDHHAGTSVHHVPERHHAWAHKLLPDMGYPVQRGERSRAMISDGLTRSDVDLYVSQMEASQRPTGKERRSSSSEEGRTGRVRRL